MIVKARNKVCQTVRQRVCMKTCHQLNPINHFAKRLRVSAAFNKFDKKEQKVTKQGEDLSHCVCSFFHILQSSAGAAVLLGLIFKL